MMISIENPYELLSLKPCKRNGFVRSPGTSILTTLQDLQGFEEVDEVDKKRNMLILVKLDRRCCRCVR